MSGNNNDRINPAIKTTTIGVKELQEISVYPLAVGEQIKLGETITELVSEFVTGLISKNKGESVKALAQMENVEFVDFIVKLIKTKISDIVKLTTDYVNNPDDLLNNITNEQFADYAMLVYEMNYGGESRKKFTVLIQNIFGLIQENMKNKVPKKKKEKK